MEIQCTECLTILNSTINVLHCTCGNATMLFNHATNDYEIVSNKENSIIYLGDYGYVEYEEDEDYGTI